MISCSHSNLTVCGKFGYYSEYLCMPVSFTMAGTSRGQHTYKKRPAVRVAPGYWQRAGGLPTAQAPLKAGTQCGSRADLTFALLLSAEVHYAMVVICLPLMVTTLR